jgi:hypothetical protein
MQMQQTQVNHGGIGFVGLLTIVFVIAKITGYVNWTWWTVFAPIWISFGVAAIIFVIALIFIIVAAWAEKRF